MGKLAVVMPHGQSPTGLPLAPLKATRVSGDVPRFAAARTRHEEGWQELGKSAENILGKGLRRVALGKGEDSFETIPEVLAGSTTGDQAWDAEVP